MYLGTYRTYCTQASRLASRFLKLLLVSPQGALRALEAFSGQVVLAGPLKSRLVGVMVGMVGFRVTGKEPPRYVVTLEHSSDATS